MKDAAARADARAWSWMGGVRKSPLTENRHQRAEKNTAAPPRHASEVALRSLCSHAIDDHRACRGVWRHGSVQIFKHEFRPCEVLARGTKEFPLSPACAKGGAVDRAPCRLPRSLGARRSRALGQVGRVSSPRQTVRRSAWPPTNAHFRGAAGTRGLERRSRGGARAFCL